jgi:hypothetical protein
MSASERPTILFVLPSDRRRRRRACRLAAKLHKARIEPLPNGKFTVKVMLGGMVELPRDEIQLYGDTRQAVSRSIDQLRKQLAIPERAIEFYRHFHHLKKRCEAGGFQRAGDMFTPDGQVTNLDTMGTA